MRPSCICCNASGSQPPLLTLSKQCILAHEYNSWLTGREDRRSLLNQGQSKGVLYLLCSLLLSQRCSHKPLSKTWLTKERSWGRTFLRRSQLLQMIQQSSAKISRISSVPFI